MFGLEDDLLWEIKEAKELLRECLQVIDSKVNPDLVNKINSFINKQIL